jgi:hypothetical protein
VRHQRNGRCHHEEDLRRRDLNEGSGVSIDDAVQEMQATFVARMVEPWSVVQSAFNTGIGGQTIQ